MEPCRVGVIVSVYKDVEALRLIMKALQAQTRAPDEIIVSEDGEDETMRNYIETLDFPIIHCTQEDKGWRKNRALNRAITKSSCDYLIFIDGDCVPYDTFVEAHMLLRDSDKVVCGRRSEPGIKFSTALREGRLSMQAFKRRYLRNFFALKRDAVRHYEQGIYLKPHGILFNLVHALKKSEPHLVGCNFSCDKEALQMINGFDEDFTMPTTGEDTDIERRLKHFGIEMTSGQYAANMIHLYHKKLFNPEITTQTEALMAQKEDVFVCKNGLESHRD